MSRKRIYFDTIDKDVRRVLGKRLYEKCNEESIFGIVAERSNGDIEYYVNRDAYYKLMKYMKEHNKCRLAKALVDVTDSRVFRFKIDAWNYYMSVI